jgi:hypothetical protein
MLISVEAMYRASSASYESAVRYLTTHTLPSSWSSSGLGWQEVWLTATHAGFYASCDGILLLDSSISSRFSITPHKLVEAVYQQHLCKIVDERVPARSANQKQARRECTSTTMRVARFLQASVNRFIQADPFLTETLFDVLMSGANTDTGTWACTLHGSDKRPALCATIEGLLAIARYKPHRRKVVSKGLQYLETIMDGNDRKRRRVALWAVTELLSFASTCLRDKAAALAVEEWSRFSEGEDDFEVQKFSLQSAPGGSGFYSYHSTLLLTTATLSLMRNSILSIENLHYTLPTVAMVAKRIDETGGYFVSKNELQFWEYYQALNVLGAFLALVEKKNQLQEEQFVLVKPKHFHTHTFKEEKDLCVVLMPFGPEWSEDVFEIFDVTVKKKGFRCWRSDVDINDDAIMQTIWDQINRARFIIADCTDRNPNVFYELGIAHTIGKPVFLCAQKRSDYPFDIQNIRSHEYGTLPKQLEALKRKIGAFAESQK